ncbi:unnamed protein product [Mesocestoides corti]|uniref:Coiled-coil domain-containing protein 39 n=1 Tax=Mesocestoides corti TaxID=53468 RepID=A0A0R3U2J1_MESCO|nr:unnamed protein product [Mesocestoides corti]
MERLSLEARQDIAERKDVLDQWEKTVRRNQHRGNEIETVLGERMAANSEKLRLQSVIRGDKIELKNLDVLIRKEEEKMANKEHIIYDQALKIFQLESRIDRLQNETPEVGSSGIQEDINKLSDELSRLSEVQIKLSDELKSIQVESKKTDHTTEKLLKEKASTSAQRTNDEVYVERTEKLLRQKRTNYNQLVVEKTMLRLKLREAEKKLIAYTDEVMNLEKYRLDMKRILQEREIEISDNKDIVLAELRLVNERRLLLRKELSVRRMQIEKLIARFEVDSMKTASSEEKETNSQMFDFIEALQELDELKLYGTDLDTSIKKSEKELEALRNTLALLKESDHLYENKCVEVNSELVNQKTILKTRCMDLRTIANEKKERSTEMHTRLKEVLVHLENVREDEMNALLCENELKEHLEKRKKELHLLKERLSRAARVLKKAKTAVINQISEAGHPIQEEMDVDIEAQLAKDLNRMTVALIMSSLKGNDEMVDHARALLNASGLAASESGPSRQSGLSSRNSRNADQQSATSSRKNAFCSIQPTARESLTEHLANTTGENTIVGESLSGRSSSTNGKANFL